MEHLEKQLDEIKASIQGLRDNDDFYSWNWPEAATTAICELPQLGSTHLRQLASLAGVAPYAKENGKLKGKRSIFARKHKLRKILYMAAVASLELLRDEINIKVLFM
ncbi:hypothetical protein MIDIC_140041 [Alphaproteobacteria bacterium]